MKLRLNPSAAHTWTECTAQPHYVRQLSLLNALPEDQSSEYSREGDSAHQVAENILKEDPVEYKVNGFKKEMEQHARDFRDYCMSFMNGGTQWFSERKVPLFYDESFNGKIDFSGLPGGRDIVICDFKYGVGVAVEAFENLQMAIYAVSLMRDIFGPEDEDVYATVTMAIYQPRVREGNTRSSWTISYGELLQFVEERVHVHFRNIRAKIPKLRFRYSEDICRFCPIKGMCGMETTVVNGKSVNITPNFKYEGKRRSEGLFDDTPFEPLRKGLPARLAKPSELPLDTVALLVLRKKEIEKVLKDAEELVKAKIREGQKVPGIKQVQGRGGHRAWKDEEAAKKLLLEYVKEEEVVTHSIVSPAQADKFEHDLPKEKWDQLKLLTYKPEGGPVLAAENDPRPAYGRRDVSDLLEDEKEDWV